MLYVDKVRTYTQTMTLNYAVERAVNECIREGILSEFLSTWKAEAIAVSIFEYDTKRDLELIRKTERKYMRSELREEVKKEVKEELRPQLIAELRPQLTEELRQEFQTEARAFAIIEVYHKLKASDKEISKSLQEILNISGQQAEEYIKNAL